MATHAPITGAPTRAPVTSRRRSSLRQSAAPPALATTPLPPIALLRALPPGPLASAHLERARQMAELFAAFENDDIEVAVDLLITEYDARQGDPDLEPNGDDEGPGVFSYKTPKDGPQLAEHRDAAIALETEDDEADGDEEDGSMAEDDFCHQSQNHLGQPGCPIADPGEDEDPDGETAGSSIDQRLDGFAARVPDDEEDDDPAGDGDPDCEAVLSVPEEASGRWGQGHGTQWAEDDEREPDDPAARRPHLRRLRRAQVPA